MQCFNKVKQKFDLSISKTTGIDKKKNRIDYKMLNYSFCLTVRDYTFFFICYLLN